jgi:Leucine-rich repeat (LRR) protein
MQEVAKHHRILDFRNVHGKEQQWLLIDCAFIDSGIEYAKKNRCKRILFGSLDDKKKANKVTIDILERFAGLEGLIWKIPIANGASLSALHTQEDLKSLSIVQPNLDIDLASFPNLESFGFSFSKHITGFDKASKSLMHIRMSGLSADLEFLGAVKSLVKLDIIRSDIGSLSGIEKIAKLEELSLTLCRKLTDISCAAKLKNLHTLSIEGCSRLTDLSVAQRFNALKTLWLKAKEIESCGFISAMKSIEFASINAVIKDNDVSPFLNSETLKEVWFSPRKRTYVPAVSPDDINERLNARHG